MYDETALAQPPDPADPVLPPEPLSWPFQLFDVELAEGGNAFTIRATDLAGNSASLSANLAFDLAGDQMPPALTVFWPPDGALVGADEFDLRGVLDDPCATVSVSGLTTEPVTGLVERDGAFWVEHLPLLPGSHTLTLTATDAVGNSGVRTLTVTRGAANLTITPPTQQELARSLLTVSGTISDNAHAVWVNGVKVEATQLVPNGAGGYDWAADNVPLEESGVGVLQVRAIPLTSNNGDGTGQDPFGVNGGLGNPWDDQAIQLQGQWERPARLFVQQYDERMHDAWPTGANCTETASQDAWMHVVRGDANGERDFVTNDPLYGQVQRMQTWPAFTDDGIGLFCIPAVSWQDQATQAVWWTLPCEYCSVSDSLPGVCGWDEYRREARTHLMLHTGGRSVAGTRNRNLFQLRVHAYAVDDPREQPPYPLDTAQRDDLTTPIPPTAIQVQGRGLDAQGRVFLALPDGCQFPITPRAPRPFYLFDIDPPVKHQLVLTADGHDLATETPEFCVGEKVDFVASFNPPLPSDVEPSSEPQWILPGKYVNHSWQHQRGVLVGDGTMIWESYGSVNYDVDVSLLKKWTTSCWFVNGPQHADLPVAFSSFIQLSRSAGIKVSAAGRLRIHRPSVVMMPFNAQEADRHFSITIIGGYFCKLKYGDDDDTAAGQMQFRVRILDPYDGHADFTQLCDTDYYSFDTSSFPWGWRLDGNTELYMHPPNGWEVSLGFTPALNELMFADTPWNISYTPNRLKARFKTYFRFRPSRGAEFENIFVTLGIVRWEMHAEAIRDFTRFTWRLTTDYHPAPTGPDDSDEFPTWIYARPE